MDDTQDAILRHTEILKRSDFYEERYGLLFEAIVELLMKRSLPIR